MRPSLPVAVLLGLLAGLLLVTGCSGAVGADAAAAAAPSPSPSPSRRAAPPPTRSAAAVRSARPSPTPSPSPTPGPPVLALTGMSPDPARSEVLDRPVLAVKVDNAREARPQEGLDRADVVFTEIVEDGLTRFLALYQSTDAGVVGPVRSGRDMDALILPAFSPVLAMSGAAPPTLAILEAAGLPMVHEDDDPRAALSRAPDRPRPHNMYIDTAIAWQQEGAGAQSAPAAWPHDPAVPPGGVPATGMDLRFSDTADAAWRWEAGSGLWRRSQDGGPHVTVAGAQLGAHNVVLARVALAEGDGVDVTGARTVDALVIGEGEAVVLRDGRSYTGRWRKTAADTQFEWLSPDGSALPLSPGTTWIELAPIDQPFAVLEP